MLCANSVIWRLLYTSSLTKTTHTLMSYFKSIIFFLVFFILFLHERWHKKDLCLVESTLLILKSVYFIGPPTLIFNEQRGFSQGRKAGALKLNHLHLVSRLRIRGAMPFLPFYDFMAWTGTNFCISITICFVTHREQRSFQL
jgi:hypothetical protein